MFPSSDLSKRVTHLPGQSSEKPTALQTVCQILLLHSLEKVQCDLLKCLSAAAPLVFFLLFQNLLILPLSLVNQKSLDLLQLIPYKSDNVVFQLLESEYLNDSLD